MANEARESPNGAAQGKCRPLRILPAAVLLAAFISLNTTYRTTNRFGGSYKLSTGAEIGWPVPFARWTIENFTAESFGIAPGRFGGSWRVEAESIRVFPAGMFLVVGWWACLAISLFWGPCNGFAMHISIRRLLFLQALIAVALAY